MKLNKIKYSRLIFLLFLIAQFGCVKKHSVTYPICNDKIFVERFNINIFGVDAEYITDSINFRYYIGKYDNEHEQLIVICNNDSLIIEKWDTSNVTFRDISNVTSEDTLISRKYLSLKKLVANK